MLFRSEPLVRTLISSAFEPRDSPLAVLTEEQRQILIGLVDCQEIWSIGGLFGLLRSYGLPPDRNTCAQFAGVKFVHDKAHEALSTGVAYSKMGFHGKAREFIERALQQDPFVFECAPAPEECWLYRAKAYAETDAKHALQAFARALAINPEIGRAHV